MENVQYFCSKFIQEIAYQISSELPEFCRRYYRKKHYGLFFSGHCTNSSSSSSVDGGGCGSSLTLHTVTLAMPKIFKGIYHTPKICNLILLLISWVRSFI